MLCEQLLTSKLSQWHLSKRNEENKPNWDPKLDSVLKAVFLRKLRTTQFITLGLTIEGVMKRVNHGEF